MERKTIYTKATITSAAAGALQADISGLTGDFLIRIKIHALAASKIAQIAIEDTVNNFSASVVRWVRSFSGEVKVDAPIELVIHSRELPALRAGTGSAELRINVNELTASGPLTLEAWIEAPAGQVTVA